MDCVACGIDIIQRADFWNEILFPDSLGADYAVMQQLIGGFSADSERTGKLFRREEYRGIR